MSWWLGANTKKRAGKGSARVGGRYGKGHFFLWPHSAFSIFNALRWGTLNITDNSPELKTIADSEDTQQTGSAISWFLYAAKRPPRIVDRSHKPYCSSTVGTESGWFCSIYRTLLRNAHGTNRETENADFHIINLSELKIGLHWQWRIELNAAYYVSDCFVVRPQTKTELNVNIYISRKRLLASIIWK